MGKTSEEVETVIRILALVFVTFFSLTLLRSNKRYARNVAIGLFTTRFILFAEDRFLPGQEYYQILLEVFGPFAVFTAFQDYFWAKNAAAVSAATLAANMVSDAIVRALKK